MRIKGQPVYLSLLGKWSLKCYVCMCIVYVAVVVVELLRCSWFMLLAG